MVCNSCMSQGCFLFFALSIIYGSLQRGRHKNKDFHLNILRFSVGCVMADIPRISFSVSRVVSNNGRMSRSPSSAHKYQFICYSCVVRSGHEWKMISHILALAIENIWQAASCRAL